jgi:SnoaL-like domain
MSQDSRLEDIEAIEQLQGRYCRTLDTKDWAGYAALFTPDAVIDTSPAGGPRFAGIDGFVNEHLIPTLQETITVHHGHTPEIQFPTPTTATGIWAMEGHAWWKSGRHFHDWGHYHETYELVDATWKITSLTLTLLHGIWDGPEDSGDQL